MASEQKQRYLAYLLRLWQVRDGDLLMWRASLERAPPGERIGFSGLDELCHFLYEQTAALSSVDSEADIEDESSGTV